MSDAQPGPEELMARLDEGFFQRKKSWSEIKDRILEGYLKPYLAKVNTLGRPIILIDGYAGPGRFADGSDGSPIIMCKAADSIVPGKYTAIFVNKDEKQHELLRHNLQALSPSGEIIPVNDHAEDIIGAISSRLNDQTVFAYLDSYATPDFRIVELLASREKCHSTEVVVNLNAQEIPRLAASKAVNRSPETAAKLNASLTAKLGGDYWKPIYFENELPEEQRLMMVASKYREMLGKYLPYTGFCPVRKTSDGRIKYFLVFCSRHPHAMLLMNDEMYKAYHQGIHATETKGMLSGFLDDWRQYAYYVDDHRPDLKKIILNEVRLRPWTSREMTWTEIVRNHFMMFQHSEYRIAVEGLVKKGDLRFVDVKKTGKLNDKSLLYV